MSGAAVRLQAAARPARTPLWRRLLGPAVGVAILLALALKVGGTPFERGLAGVSPTTVVVALALTAVSTAAASWRWAAVSQRLGVDLGWRRAVLLYYRSQFVNAVLPGGVVGDVQRAVDERRRAGRAAETGGRRVPVPEADGRADAIRAVAIERVAGQVVQIVMAAVAAVAVVAWGGGSLPAAPGGLLAAPGLLLAALAVAVAGIAAAGAVAVATSGRVRGALARELARVRAALADPATVAVVALSSGVVVACHAATFAVAARAVGVRAPTPVVVALALAVLVASAVPVNIGGWGPREGASAGLFALAGLGDGAGVAASTLFGVLALLSVAPGAVALVALHLRAHGERRSDAEAPAAPASSAARAAATSATGGTRS
ncbi:lysylphosphatidylglycerol synthase transmembrane domain-containing protein [Frondihabitans australicus]|uniref:Uncharacterized membrane protein YbhN (UPF0104 family) n=1 Tax=Frondihabitans australicus TaxID=386892 RepID=A0A495IJE8_9MICO|nr:lysylphosphatidylglycerol synthase transmembrane domain-containing protein [Frondihabitans australicus]RKR75246.1 uncharacterized membrane protein YbhN (UPF0104 family) [Frondihabitans australicus]